MRYIRLLFILPSCFAVLFSCKKNDPTRPVNPPPSEPPLQIVSFEPASAAKDSIITIKGKSFSTTPASNKVTINNVPATVLSATNDILTVKVPLHAGTGVVQVQVGDQTAG